MKNFLFRYLFPGLLMFCFAFFAALHPDPTWGLLGFLPFFTVGVLVIIRGIERLRKKNDKE